MTTYRNQPVGRPFMVVHFEQGSPLIIDADSRIIRTDMPFRPSEDWKFLGFVNRYEHLVLFAPSASERTRYKNGRGMFWFMDSDHGTQRIQGSRVTEISVYDKDGKYVPPVEV